MRSSDINKQRKLRFGQAIMLGVVFRVRGPELSGSDWNSKKLWAFTLPDTLVPPDVGYVSGHFTRRWEAVDAALNVAGVI